MKPDKMTLGLTTTDKHILFCNTSNR